MDNAKIGIAGSFISWMFYLATALGVLSIFLVLYILVKRATRTALKDTVKKDYGKVKERGAGSMTWLRNWRKKHLQAKLDKIQKKLSK